MRRDYLYYIYILTNKTRGVLYIGVTRNLFSRILQHKVKKNKDSFSAKYNLNKLVYFEEYNDVHEALNREKQLKNWRRDWKINLIEKENPTWHDYFLDMG